MSSPSANPFVLLFGGIQATPIGLAYIALRFLVSFIVITVYVIFDLITTIFKIIWKLITDIYPFLLIVALIFIFLLLIHLYWSQFVTILNDDILPVMQVFIDDVVRFTWNDLFIPVSNILIDMWDSLVQLIGFFIYFVLNLAITLFQIIVQVIGEIDLPAIFDDVMEIVTPLIKMVTEIVQVLIQVGSAIIVKLIPIAIAILKIWFAYIKILFKIFAFLIITLFRILKPILAALVDIVSIFFKLFAGVAGAAGMVSKKLLQFNERYSSSIDNSDSSYNTSNKTNSKLGSASRNDEAANKFVQSLFEHATESYQNSQYQAMMESLLVIHRGIKAEDAFHSVNGYYLDPGSAIPDYARHLYDEEELDEHQRPAGVSTGIHNPGAKPAEPGEVAYLSEFYMTKEEEKQAIIEEKIEESEESNGVGAPADETQQENQRKNNPIIIDNKNPNKRNVLQWQGLDTSKLSLEERLKLEQTSAEFLDSLKDDQLEPEVPEEPEIKTPTQPIDQASQQSSNPSYRTDVNPYSIVHRDDHWKIDHSAKMKSEQVFPHLKGKKLKRVRFEELHKTPTPEQTHERRKRAVAYTHAVQYAYYKAHKRHISSGNLHRITSNTLKKVSGHNSFDSFFKTFNKKYVSVDHFMYESIPAIHNMGFFRLWKDADPKSKSESM